MKIFEYAAILHPTKQGRENGEPSTFIIKPKSILAHDQNSAMVMASRELPNEVLDKLDRVEVAVRPF